MTVACCVTRSTDSSSAGSSGGGRAGFYTVAESDKQKAGKAITLGKGPEQPQLILGLKTRSKAKWPHSNGFSKQNKK